ncbi:FG-GAP-like repeat-containing protein [bacterium]|nr:FG-GAP-like repeat-containing protein [bacterium]
MPLYARLTIFLTFALLLQRAHAKDLFEINDLTFVGNLTSYHAEDINKDGLTDLLLSLTRSSSWGVKQRWLSLYLQEPEGFSRTPTQSFKVSSQVILFDIGDVAGNTTNELVYFGGRGLYYYTFGENGFNLEPKELFEAESLFMLADTRSITHWNFVADLNGDDMEEILIPNIHQTEVHYRNKSNGHWLKTEIGLGAESLVSGAYHKRYSVGKQAESRYTTPYIAMEDFDADSRKDLIGVYRDSIVVLTQNDRGLFSDELRQKIPSRFGEIWRGQKIHRTRIGDKSERTFLKRVKDLNDDGLLDVLSIRVSTKESIMSPKHEIRVHFGTRDTVNSQTRFVLSPEPDQIIKPGGVQLIFDILDLNGDGRSDLVAPIVKVGLRNIVRMLLTRSVQIEGEVYLMGESGRYPEKPSRSVKMVVNFSFRGGTTSPVYELADFNGDGLIDVMTSIEEKRLVIFWGDRSHTFESHVGAKFPVLLPQNGELIQAVDLNSDTKSDLIVTYNEDNSKHPGLLNTLRVLMAR